MSVQITGSGATNPTVGQSYILSCIINGTDNDNITYQWRKDGTLLLTETGPALSFSSLRLSNIGRYTCEVTVDGTKFSTVEEFAVASKIYVATYTKIN